jgi:hypothetical protein
MGNLMLIEFGNESWASDNIKVFNDVTFVAGYNATNNAIGSNTNCTVGNISYDTNTKKISLYISPCSVNIQSLLGSPSLSAYISLSILDQNSTQYTITQMSNSYSSNAACGASIGGTFNLNYDSFVGLPKRLILNIQGQIPGFSFYYTNTQTVDLILATKPPLISSITPTQNAALFPKLETTERSA